MEISEKTYRDIFENSLDAICLVDLKGKIVEINHAAIQSLGYDTRKDLSTMKSTLQLFEAPEDLTRLQERLTRDGFVKEFETCLVGGKGRTFDASMTSNVIVDPNGQPAGYVVIIRDITKIKQAQHEIQTQNTRLAALNAISTTVSNSLDLNEVLETTIDEILRILEADSVRIYLLDKESESLRLAAQEGLSNEFLSRPYITSRKVGDGLLGQTFKSGKPMLVDNLMRSEDPYVASIIREGLRATAYIPLISQSKSVGMMCVSAHSEFKFSADYMEFLTPVGNQIGVAVDSAHLYESAKNAYRDLKKAQEQVIRTEKLSSLGKLAATIAHEINNPLAAVLTYIRLMIKLVTLKRFTPDRLDDISRYLSIMESETARCGEVVKNLLAFSRQSRTIMGAHDIEEIIDKSLVLIAHDLKMREIILKKEIEPDLPRVQCDFKQIQQTILNLLSNASEAMTSGGAIAVTARRSTGNTDVEIAISDTGCGISESDLKNIFEPFFTSKEEGKGVGLGLSVVYGIIARHDGAINVESKPSRGSVFTVRLPVAP